MPPNRRCISHPSVLKKIRLERSRSARVIWLLQNLLATFLSLISTRFSWLLTFLPRQNYSHDMRIQQACRSGCIFVDLRYLFDTHMPLFYKQSGMIFCHKEQLLNLPFAFTSPQRKHQNIPLLLPLALPLVVQCFFLLNVHLFSLAVTARCFVFTCFMHNRHRKLQE